MKGYSKGFIVVILTFGALYSKDHVQKKWHLKGWYQQKEQKLNQQIKTLDQKAAGKYKADLMNIRACIVPHAGLKYSGTVAAGVFRLIDPKKVKRIIILAPSHKIPFKGFALPYYESYAIPTGVLPVDKKALSVLSRSSFFHAQQHLFKDPYTSEHSLEIELPLIKHYFGNTPIVPLILGHLSETDRVEAVKILRNVIDDKTLVVVSSDFIHYGPRFDYQPFKQKDHLQDRIKQLDGSILEKIFSGSSKKFLSLINTKEATVCGKYPIALLLDLIQENVFGKVEPYMVAYSTSQEHDSSDPSHSVSYAGVVYASEKDSQLPHLTDYEKNELLALAREAIEQSFEKTKDSILLYPIKTNTLKGPYGAFVTLYTKNNTLRGCIGSITTNEPLYKTIMQRAKSAAFQDSRFKPLTQSELATIRIKISVLSTPKAVASYKDIKLGRDGIILKNGFHQAVFLPAVPKEQGWTLKQTLEQLSKKAGLFSSAWKDKKTKFEIFQSVDFGEEL